ncbi:MAG: alpha/beta hydrolase [Gammaproteobacteria bacterium]
MPRAAESIALASLAHAPWPLKRDRGADGGPFFDVRDGARRGRTTRHGEVFWEQPTYADDRSLLALPADFDPARPATLVVFLHGNGALLERDVWRRQRVPAQVLGAGRNAALIAPQLARDAPDSSGGRFAVRGVFSAYLEEACAALARHCAPSTARAKVAATLADARVILVAYSGGYCPAAAALTRGNARRRVAGLVLLDALYDHAALFANWFATHRRHAFLVSAHTVSTRARHATFERRLAERGVPVTHALPTTLAPGAACLLPVPGTCDHAALLTHGWCRAPLRDLLRRLPP